MKTNQGYLFGSCCIKKVSYHHLCFEEMQKQAGKWEDVILKKGAAFRHALFGDWQYKEAADKLSRSRVSGLGSTVIIDRSHWPSPNHSKMIDYSGVVFGFLNC